MNASEERIKALCAALLRTEDADTAQAIADELQAAIREHVALRCNLREVPDYRPAA